MIPEFYFEDPFPINIPAYFLSDCYISEDPKHDPEEWIRIWAKAINGEPEDLMELRELYQKMVYFYMEKNFKKKGAFAIIHDAHNIVKACEDDGTIRNFFKEFGIEFSHLYWNIKTDLQIIVVPFESVDRIMEMKDKIKLSNAIEVWEDGFLIEDT